MNDSYAEQMEQEQEQELFPPAEAPEGFPAIGVRGRTVLLTLFAVVANIYLVTPLTVLGLFRVLGMAAQSDEGRLLFTILVLTIQSMVTWLILYVLVVRFGAQPWAALGLRPAPRVWFTRAAVLAVAAVPLVGGINLLLTLILGETVRNPQLEALAPQGFTWHGLLTSVITAGLIAPIFEELVFRGLLFSWLRGRLAFAPAAGLSAAAFALAHGLPILMPALFAVGLLLAFVYEKSRSLWPTILVHCVFNILMTLALYAALAAGLPLT
jgi:membrane protease YdiL (CAAX protease family)